MEMLSSIRGDKHEFCLVVITYTYTTFIRPIVKYALPVWNHPIIATLIKCRWPKTGVPTMSLETLNTPGACLPCSDP